MEDCQEVEGPQGVLLGGVPHGHKESLQCVRGGGHGGWRQEEGGADAVTLPQGRVLCLVIVRLGTWCVLCQG